MSIIHCRIIVSGKVQGVFYRASARDKARELGIKGFARNEPDGTVYIEAEGEKSVLDQFVDWCKKGPKNALVTRITVSEEVPQGHTNFEIRKS